MRRIFAATMVGLVITSFFADAVARPRRSTRHVSAPYTQPAIGAAGAGVCLQGESCVFLGPPRKGETHLAVGIVDDTTLPFITASVIQDTSGDGNFLVADDYTAHLCGETMDPIPLKPKADVSVWVWPAPGPGGWIPVCPGVATSGSVEAFFIKKDR